MPSRIIVNTDWKRKNPVYHDLAKPRSNNVPFTEAFCKEQPLEVLRTLGPAANINAYKSLLRSGLDYLATSKDGTFHYAIAILDGAPTPGTSISSDLRKLDFSWLGAGGLSKEHQVSLDSFITQHLIETKNSPSYIAILKGRGPQSFGGQVMDVRTYFEGRRSRAKEAKLREILEFGQIMVSPDIDREYVRTRSEELAYNLIGRTTFK